MNSKSHTGCPATPKQSIDLDAKTDDKCCKTEEYFKQCVGGKMCFFYVSVLLLMNYCPIILCKLPFLMLQI